MSRPRWEGLLPIVLGVALSAPGGSPGQEPGGAAPVDPAEKRFGELDVSKDGRLSREEAAGGSGRLGKVFDRYDANRDDAIGPGEYRVYYAAANGLPPPPDIGSRDEPKPVAYRYGQLPKGLPDYFTTADADRDGQVGLYEWARHWDPTEKGLPETRLAEFKGVDLNGDGLLTAEEYLRWTRKAALAKEGGGPPGGGQPPVARTPPPPGAAADPPKKDARRPGDGPNPSHPGK
jgi:hypothetical protein